MARKKRGGKVSGKKVRQTKEIIADENVTQSPTESEESCSSGTPKSCNTPVEVEKAISNTTLVQHKKFGKFRCLLLDDVNKTEISSSESEVQVDSAEIETKNVELLTLDTENIINNLKSVEICETESLQDIPVSAEEVIQEEMAIDSVDSVCDVQMQSESCSEIEIKQNLPSIQHDEGIQQFGILSLQEGIDKESDEYVVNNPEVPSDSVKSNNETDPSSDSQNGTTVRRSSRIRSITVLKQRSKGHGLVKTDKAEKKDVKLLKASKSAVSDVDIVSENSNSNTASNEKLVNLDSPSFVAPTVAADSELKPVKVKSRWRRSSELEMGGSSPLTVQPLISPQVLPDIVESVISTADTVFQQEGSPLYDEELDIRMKQFHMLSENQYLTDRVCCKEAKKMGCDCFLTKEEIERGEFACGQDCLNRLLMIECGNQCIVGDRCTNKRFQKIQYAPCEVFRTDKKGFGIRATGDIPFGEFILEYVGEVLGPFEFQKRAKEYSKDKNQHYYFMALRADAVIDATQKGNISRFINHSCDPNAETQKWTVNGELRIGFFSKRTISAGEEITFDYQFQRYGKEAQKCYCEAVNCRGWIGEEPEDEDDDEDDSEREEENEDDEHKEIDSAESGVKEPKVSTKPKTKRKKLIKKPRKDLFEDLDLDEEIDVLSTTGVKNQAHTLKLSRLMVRAKDVGPRMQLLQLLRDGDLPCRRLFLDYHGLRLIHGWMCDAPNMTDSENKNNLFRKEILLTLASLPIPNKTMLQDSKVLQTVEVWSTGINLIERSPLDSDSNSPQISSVSPPTTELSKKEPVKSPTELDIDTTTDMKEEFNQDEKNDDSLDVKEECIDLPTPMEVDMQKEAFDKSEDKLDKENEKLIADLTGKLLNDWSVLKEIFRIPKKERIEQMKEHEREADRDYKAGANLEQESTGKRDARYSWKNERYRILEKERRKAKEASDHDRTVSKKGVRLEERNIVPIPKLSKHERRQLFALQVAQEEAGRRRKQEQELWRQHEQSCMVLGVDPRLTNLEPAANYPCYWNPATTQWQNFPPPATGNQQSSTPLYDVNCVVQQPRTPLCTNAAPPMLPQSPGVTSSCPADGRGAVIAQPFPQPVAKEEGAYTPTQNPGQQQLTLPLPVKLPPKWKSARDKYGRPYYYHIKIRISQWEPPDLSFVEDTPPDIVEESSSSTESSSISSDSSTDSDEDSEIGDTRLLLEIRNKLKHIESETAARADNIVSQFATVDVKTESPKPEVSEEPSKSTELVQKRKRDGLVQEIIISPRREEDKIAHKAELKKYKETKEKLRRQKQLLLEQTRKRLKSKLSKATSSKSSKKHRSSKSLKHKMLSSDNSEESKKIKELFRSSMASVMVQNLNAYRKPECKTGRITNTEDFKHLARKLTHFVMLKELKHCQSIEELMCNDSVKTKAKDFVKKYMSKFGELYLRPKDELD